MGKKISEMTEAELNEHYRKCKIREDSKALKKYAKRLRDERKTYEQKFEAYSINQRKSRALALGSCALKAIDAVRELAKVKPLVAGTLEYVMNEQKVTDEAGAKGFYCSVIFHVVSDEPAHDPEDIRKEIEETFEKMMRETDAMYPPEEKHEEKESERETV